MTAIPSLRASAGDSRRTAVPFSRMAPESGGSAPHSTRISVDLPAPFCPSRKWTSPPATVSETSSSARTPGKLLEMPRISRRGMTSFTGDRNYNAALVKNSWLANAGLRLSDWFETWFPDAFALALVAVVIVFSAAVSIGNSPVKAASWFGAGFWDLLNFTMQMTLIIITGYSVATAPPVYRIVCRLAEIPKSGRAAVAFVALFSMLSSLISWSFSLIISGLLAREVTHRVKGADYRAVGAAAYLGIGSVWALGLSSSAALIMAAPGSLPQSILSITGVIPLSQTLLLWQSMLTAAVLTLVSMTICYYSAPGLKQA